MMDQENNPTKPAMQAYFGEQCILDLNLGDTWGEKKETSKGVGVKLKEE